MWKGGAFPVPLGCLSRLITVDMCTPIKVMLFPIGVHLITYCTNKTTPRTVGAVTGRLTKPLTEVTIMAGTQHTETRPNYSNKFSDHCFTWRFLALSAAKPRLITIVAASEQEARQQSPAGCVMVFAARIRKEVLEVRHVQ
ncbi:host cell division inhibitor Icd-like protein [Salmonella enterica]|uniref:host cell division inhibitor Icd-like protein n=1 Tax=Salmonella enterica TaxID=28901 RepID=UPI002A241A8C|nr:host cell division inhibitor Icd-like protein [Salmonella enterica]